MIDHSPDNLDNLMSPESSRLVWVSKDWIGEYIDSLSLDSFRKQFLLFTIDMENMPRSLDGMEGYEIEREGTYKGLGQFSENTWTGLQKHGLKYDYSQVGNPRADIDAILHLLDDSARYHRRYFGEEIDDVRLGYLYHNQGAGAAKHFLTTGKIRYPGQSNKALNAFEELLLSRQSTKKGISHV